MKSLRSGIATWACPRIYAMMEVQSECEVIPRDFLCCKLCDEEYKQPKHLVCFHSFCRQCIIDYMHKHCDPEDQTYWCPICGTETNISDLGLKDLPDNLLARRLSSPAVETQERDKICKICKNTGNFLDAKSYCINCDDFLCRQCTDAHMAQDETASHKVETMEEYQVRTEFEESGKKMHVVPRCCSYYDPLDIGALFCVDCDSAVCADCHLSYHEDHRCAEMIAVAENFQNKIKQPLDELQNDASQLQEAMMCLQRAEQQTIEQQKELHAIVSRRKKYLSDMINEYENVLLEEIDRRHTQHLDDIHQRRKEMQMHLAAIDGVNDFTEKLLSYGSFEEKVLMRKKVGKRVRELCEEPLMLESMEPEKISLREPNVAIETICNMFGELSTNNASVETEVEDRGQMYQTSVDSGHESEVADTNELNAQIGGEEIIESESDALESTTGSDFKMLTLSNSSDGLRNVKFREQVDQTEYEADNCFTLDTPKREITLPQTIQHECLKGMGINKHGDIIVGASAANYQMVYLLEKRGIIRGQIPVQTGWNIHSVSSDGKVALTIARGDNRFKIRIMKNDGSGQMLTNTQIENFGLNFATANQSGQLIVTSNRYSHITNFGKMTSKAGGNIAIFDNSGVLKRRITNEDYQDLGMYILEKPHTIAVDNDTGCFFVTDPAIHNVTGYDRSGELMFEYGNSDVEPEVYEGPDLVCADAQGHVLVADKRLGKIDVLNHKGKLKKSLFTEDIIKFIAVTPEKLLMLATADGNIKFYEYLNL